MKRLLAATVSLLFAALGFCQTRPILLSGPDAQGSSLAASLDAVKLAKDSGYNGISLGIGIQRFSNPESIDLSGVRTVTRAAMDAGLQYVCWRLDVDVPNNQAWADYANGGAIWPVATRPPQGAWVRIAQIWQSARDLSAQEITAAGKSPSKVLIFVLANEPGIGGVGGPSLGPWSYSSFYYNLYRSTGDTQWFLAAFPAELLGAPEGYIEPGFWTMLRGIRGRVNFGAKAYCVSFEGADSSLPAQLASVTGTDAEWLYTHNAGFALNVFGTNARKLFDSVTGTVTRAPLTPVQESAAFSARLDKVLGQMRQTPLLANEGVLLTEFNISTGRIPDFSDPFLYREELLKGVMAYPGLDGAMIFSAFADDPTANSMQLFNRIFANGVYTIEPVGSNPVGPANLGLVP